MGIKDLINKFRNKDSLFNEYQKDDIARNKVEERKLSSEERALMKIVEKNRQDKIKAKLNQIHKQARDEFWHKDVISQKNLFRENPTILSQGNLFRRKK